MIGTDFTFNHRSLSDFEMKMYDPDQEQEFIGRTIDKSDISSLKAVPNHYSAYYSDTLVLSFLIMKDICLYEKQEEFRLSSDEINTLRAWIESPKSPKKLHVSSDYDDDNLDTYYFGVFTNVQPFIFNADCYGLYLTFTCNAPYGFSDTYKSVYKIGGKIGDFHGAVHNISSEYREYLKPVIKIYSDDIFSGDEMISITNHNENDRKINLMLPKGRNQLVIDCDKKRITDESGNLVPLHEVGVSIPNVDEYNFISARICSIRWLRLIPGMNRLTITTYNQNNITKIEISTRFIIKSGGF